MLWIVTRGEYGEGQSPKSLHLLFNNALAAAETIVTQRRHEGAVHFEKVQSNPERWEHNDGCDVTAVSAIEVQP